MVLVTSTDNRPPTIVIQGPLSGRTTDRNVTVTGQVTDNLSGVARLEARLDSGRFVPVALDHAGHFAYTTHLALDGSADGEHTVSLRATDRAGNVSRPVSVRFNLDTKASRLGKSPPLESVPPTYFTEPNTHIRYMYADKVLEFYDSGTGPMPGPYGGTNHNANVEPFLPKPVSLKVVLGPTVDKTGAVDSLALPTGSYVTVGFPQPIVDGPRADIIITKHGTLYERANFYVKSSTSDWVYLGSPGKGLRTSYLELQGLRDSQGKAFTDPIVAVKIVGFSYEGKLKQLDRSPGYDVASVAAVAIGSNPVAGTADEIQLQTVGQTQINPTNNYSEDTKVLIKVVHAKGHPLNGLKDNKFSGLVTITEEPGTNYYNGLNGASTLPMNVQVTNGEAMVVLRSVSESNSVARPTSAKIKVTSTSRTAVPQAATNPLPVVQWVDNNSDGVPDWLEKHVYKILKEAVRYGGEVGTVVRTVTGIVRYNGPSPGGTDVGTSVIGINPANTVYGSLRLNNSILPSVVLHEARHAWQNAEAARNHIIYDRERDATEFGRKYGHLFK